MYEVIIHRESVPLYVMLKMPREPAAGAVCRLSPAQVQIRLPAVDDAFSLLMVSLSPPVDGQNNMIDLPSVPPAMPLTLKFVVGPAMRKKVPAGMTTLSLAPFTNVKATTGVVLLAFAFNCVWIAEVTPLTYPSSVFVATECVGIPFASDISALLAVMADASTIAPPELCITRLLFSAAEEFVPPSATDTSVPPTR